MNRYYATRRHSVIESLENRAVMDAAQITWADTTGILSIYGDPFDAVNDFVTITVTENKDYILVKVQGEEDWNGEDHGAEPSECKGITFQGAGGDDLLDMVSVNSANGFQATNLNGNIDAWGHDGRDSIYGSEFADKIERGRR
jgi:hypothetical protein